MRRGQALSAGIGRGPAVVLRGDPRIGEIRRGIDERDVGTELRRVNDALRAAEIELRALKAGLPPRAREPACALIDVQLAILRDSLFAGQLVLGVGARHLSAEAVLSDLLEGYSRTAAEMPDPYLGERATDVRDVGRRVMAHLTAHTTGHRRNIPPGSVVVVEELLPSSVARLREQGAVAFLSETGSAASHAAILLRAFGIPGVSGLAGITREVEDGDEVIVDGTAGLALLRPGASLRSEYELLRHEQRARRLEDDELRVLSCETSDGTAVQLVATIDDAAQVEAAIHQRAAGIGLLRTELVFAAAGTVPGEEEQRRLYQSILEQAPGPVVIRLFDLGGDKGLVPTARSPLGLRGVRLLLAAPALLHDQLRALLRAAVHGDVRVLVPMLSDADELRAVRASMTAAEQSLRTEGVAFRSPLQLGAMIEVPSAAVLAREIAREADFLSIGTNDLVQYLLAVERDDPTMAPYYQLGHPAVLRVIASILDAAAAVECPVTVCGEMAANERFTKALLGLGARALSVAPDAIARIKRVVRSTRMDDAQRVAHALLAASSIEEVATTLGATTPPP
jgi:phosphotransferase system enzyme I (PtsI)